METMAELIHRTQEGDAEAYGVLVNRFEEMAYGYAYAILGDFAQAQDAAQEAFIEAYVSLTTLRDALAFPSWLKRIVFKQCDRLTRGKRLATVPLDAAVEVASPHPGPAEVAERRELARRVEEAIRALPVAHRVVTTLFYINGYSHQEIADFLGVPAKTVKSRLHTSRGRLRERMIDMVEDELKANALPPSFAQETVEQAVARAAALRKEHHIDEAEELLRRLLQQLPEHPEVLRELNRALTTRVYEGRWDLLREVAEHGRVVLQATEDELVHRQFAETLMAIPAMPEAVQFLENWIARKGVNMERLGMLAWSRGCVADYDAAEARWQELLALTPAAQPEEIVNRVSFVAYTLVDCFAEAGEVARAQHVVQQAWDLCRDLGPVPFGSYVGGDMGWLRMFHQAGLQLSEVARFLLARTQGSTDLQSQATVLCIRSWLEDPQAVVADSLAWARARVAAGDWQALEQFRGPSRDGFRARREWDAYNQLAEGIWQLLGQAESPEAEKIRVSWGWERSNPLGAILAGDWATAEAILQRKLQESGFQGSAVDLFLIAVGRGEPTPPEVVQLVDQQGVDALGFGMNGWYVLAREAAAAGDQAKAFDALRRALSYWSNPPYMYVELFENDQRWGVLRQHPEFGAAFEEKRRRVGPICGLLHYFPWW